MEVATPTMNTLVVKSEMSRSPMPSLGASTPGRTGRGRPGPAAPSWPRAPAPVAASAGLPRRLLPLPWPPSKGGRAMPGLSVHAVDVTRGRPAQGMQIDIYALEGERTADCERQAGRHRACSSMRSPRRGVQGRAVRGDLPCRRLSAAAGVPTSDPAVSRPDVPFRFTDRGSPSSTITCRSSSRRGASRCSAAASAAAATAPPPAPSGSSARPSPRSARPRRPRS